MYLTDGSHRHVGSTSIPGLSAKPAIDIDVIVAPEHLQNVLSALQTHGQYESLGECGVPDRYRFALKVPENPPRNLYVCLDGCLSLRNHLVIREQCRSNVEVRDQYKRLKETLAQQDWKSVDEYCEAKTEFLSGILKDAGFNAIELGEIKASNTI